MAGSEQATTCHPMAPSPGPSRPAGLMGKPDQCPAVSPHGFLHHWGAPLVAAVHFTGFGIVQSWALCFGVSWGWVGPPWLWVEAKERRWVCCQVTLGTGQHPKVC